MNTSRKNEDKLLLHACCGPCSLEPSRILKNRGEVFDIFYANSNIAPGEEYSRRLSTLRIWAEDEDIKVIEGKYDHKAWAEACKNPYEEGSMPREERCRQCYRLRFEESARYAKENGYGALCTTLSVSPYQYTDVIAEELVRACEQEGVECLFEDFRPYYDEATRRSREGGMYRQNYCGCEISAIEAQKEREERKTERKRAKELKRRSMAEEIALEESRLAIRRQERKEYDERQARKRAILKQLREERKHVG